jgi:hypothetical protein
MQPYYPPPSPYGTWAPPRPEPIPRPSSSARLEHHSPDVHSSPQTSYSVHPTKAWARSDTPTQIGRSPSALSHHSHQQAFESQVPPRIYKTLLQWKEEARAMTADYQRNGYPSAVAWVLIISYPIPITLTCYVGLRGRPRHPSECYHRRYRPQGNMVHRPSVL